MSPPLDQTNTPREKTESGSESFGPGAPVRSVTGRSGTKGLSQSDLSRVLDERGFSEVPSCSCGKKADAIAARVRAGLSRDAATADVEAKIATSGISSVEVQAPVVPKASVPQKSEADKKADTPVSGQKSAGKHKPEEQESHDHPREKTSGGQQTTSGGIGSVIDSISSWTSGVNVSSLVQGLADGASDIFTKITSVAHSIQNAFTDLVSTTSDLEREVGRFGTDAFDEERVDELKVDAERRLDALDKQIGEAHCQLEGSENLNARQRATLGKKLEKALEQKTKMEKAFKDILEGLEKQKAAFEEDSQKFLECCDEHGVCGPHRCEVDTQVKRANQVVDKLSHGMAEHVAQIEAALKAGKLDEARELLKTLEEHSKEVGSDIEEVSKTLGKKILEHGEAHGESESYLSDVRQLSATLVENQRNAWNEIRLSASVAGDIGMAYTETLYSIQDMGVRLGDIAVLGIARTDAALRSKWTPGTLYSGAYAMSDLYFYEEVEKLEAGIPFPMEASEESLSGSFTRDDGATLDSLDVFHQKESSEGERFARVIEGVFEQSEAQAEKRSLRGADAVTAGSEILASVSADLERELGGAMDSFLADTGIGSTSEESLVDEDV